MTWRIYYADGSTFSSEDGRPQDSPAWGAVVIAQRVGNQFAPVLCAGTKQWIYREDLGFWQEPDDVGFIDVMAHDAHNVSAVRYGRMIRKDVFESLWAAARAWADG